MVKLKSAYLYSISGTIGKKHTFKTKSNGTIVLCENVPAPTYTRTEKQDNIRKGYKRLASLWKNNIKQNDELFSELAKKENITAYNKFLSIYRKLQSYNPTLLLGLDEGSGETANDYTANENNGAIIGASWKKLNNKKNALYLNNIGDRIEFNNFPSPELLPNNSLSVLAFVKITSDSDGFIDFARQETTFLLRRDNANENKDITFFIHDGISWEPRAYSNFVPEIGQWYMVVGTFDGNYLKIYIDGKLKGTRARTTTIQKTTNTLYWGAFGTGDSLIGYLTLGAIFPIALSEAQIKEIYEQFKQIFTD